jgi:hypothetical protein
MADFEEINMDNTIQSKQTILKIPTRTVKFNVIIFSL